MTLPAKRFAEPRGRGRISLRREEPELTEHSFRISVGASPDVFFHRKLHVSVSPDGHGYRCEIPELGVSQYEAKKQGARQAVATALRDETAKLLATLTHELDTDQRARKRLLLGNVDVVRSGMVRNAPAYTWVLGTVEVDPEGQRRWFRAVGSEVERYAFAPDLPGVIPEDSFVRMAKVRAGSIGEPFGPVMELEPPLGTDPEATWAAWQRKLEEHE